MSYGAENASGTLTGAETDPTASGFEDVLLAAPSTGTGDQKGFNVSGEIPIIDTTPQFSYGLTDDLASDHVAIITGYPKGYKQNCSFGHGVYQHPHTAWQSIFLS